MRHCSFLWQFLLRPNPNARPQPQPRYPIRSPLHHLQYLSPNSTNSYSKTHLFWWRLLNPCSFSGGTEIKTSQCCLFGAEITLVGIGDDSKGVWRDRRWGLRIDYSLYPWKSSFRVKYLRESFGISTRVTRIIKFHCFLIYVPLNSRKTRGCGVFLESGCS